MNFWLKGHSSAGRERITPKPVADNRDDEGFICGLLSGANLINAGEERIHFRVRL